MSGLKLNFSCGLYDRTQPLFDGRVKPEGIDLNYIPLEPEELFWRMAQYSEFDVSEFSLAAFNILHGQGDKRFIGIPVFPSRMFRHSAIFINTKSGIKKPEDLRGKRVGVPDYTMTAPVWIRGLLEHEYGVKATEMNWLIGGLNKPGRKQRVRVDWPKELKMEDIGNERTLSNMLAAGEIDALIGARQPQCFDDGVANVEPLWKNAHEAELEYYKKTKLFPIMHLIVIKRSIYEQNPWVAVSLYKAFQQAKEMVQKSIYTLAAARYMIPGVEKLYKRITEVMGEDYWSYGYNANKHVLDTFNSYAKEQFMIPNTFDTKELFCPSVLSMHTI